MNIKIAILGKGGSGKTFIATNLSIYLSKKNIKILHIGCDPKMDSTLPFFKKRIQAFMSINKPYLSSDEIYSSIYKSDFYPNIDCIEIGGPEPGIGCAGAIIGNMLKILKDNKIIDKYDIVVFDILGDIICGGFSIPIREGFADKIFIVSGGDFASIYAANRLIKMVLNTDMGSKLCGIIGNIKNEKEIKTLLRFSKTTNVPIVTIMKYNPSAINSDKSFTFIENNEIRKNIEEISKVITKNNKAKIYYIAENEIDNLQILQIPKILSNSIIDKNNQASKDKKLTIDSRIVFSEIIDRQLLFKLKISNVDAIEFLLVPKEKAIELNLDLFGPDWTIGYTNNVPQNLQQKTTKILIKMFSNIKNFYFKEILSYYNINYSILVPHYYEYKKDDEQIKNIGIERDLIHDFKFFQEENQNTAELFFDNIAIENGDLECKFSEGYLNFPKSDSNIINTELDDKVLYFGIKDEINHIFNKISKSKDIIVQYHHCCLPMLLSEIPVIKNNKNFIFKNFNTYDDISTDKEKEIKLNHFIKMYSKYHKKNKLYDLCIYGTNILPEKINEIIYNSKIRFTLTSNMDVELYKKMALSKLIVINKPHLIIQEALKRLKHKFIITHPSIGIKYTENFLKAIATNLNIKFSIKKDVVNLINSFNNYKKIAKDINCIFITNDIEDLIDGKLTNNIKILDIIEEMGINIVICMNKNNENIKKQNIKRLNISYFNTYDELIKIIKSYNKKLVYSYLDYDTRLASIGVETFNVNLLEYGYKGALENIKKIIKLTSSKLYEKYIEYKNKI